MVHGGGFSGGSTGSREGRSQEADAPGIFIPRARGRFHPIPPVKEVAATTTARFIREESADESGPRSVTRSRHRRAFLIGGPNAEVAERSAHAGDVTGAPGPLASASGRADASREWSGRARRFPGGPNLVQPAQVRFLLFFFFLFSVSFLFQIQTSIQIQTLWHFIYWLILSTVMK
jgi:hypothetical protein